MLTTSVAAACHDRGGNLLPGNGPLRPLVAAFVQAGQSGQGP
jgi:hypothetical protein